MLWYEGMTEGNDQHEEYLYRSFIKKNQGYAIIFFDEAGHITGWNEVPSASSAGRQTRR
jgi:hypothetical protein